MACCEKKIPPSDYPKWSGNPANRVPTDGRTETWDGGTPYQARASWEQSGRSNQMPGVMPRTGWRAAGLWKRPRPYAGGREPQGDKRSRQTKFQAWRAVCCESSLHGSGRGGWKRAVFLILPGRESLTRQVRTVGGTSLATYFMKVVGEAPPGRSRRLIVTEHGMRLRRTTSRETECPEYCAHVA